MTSLWNLKIWIQLNNIQKASIYLRTLFALFFQFQHCCRPLQPASVQALNNLKKKTKRFNLFLIAKILEMCIVPGNPTSRCALSANLRLLTADTTSQPDHSAGARGHIMRLIVTVQ